MCKKEIPLALFEIRRGTILEENDSGTVYNCPTEGLELFISVKEIFRTMNISTENMKYLAVEIECLEEHSLTLNVEFLRHITEETYDMRILFGILPKVHTVVPIDFSLLNSQTLFPERTEGRLKMVVYGKPISVDEIDSMRISTAPSYHKHHIRIKSIFLVDTEVQYSLPPKKLMDEMGQWIPKEWPKKAQNREHCNELLHKLLKKADEHSGCYQDSGWDKYGGWKKKFFGSTGWFRTEYDGKRWWLVDPEGYAFFSVGIDCISPGTDTRVDVMKQFCTWLPSKDGEYAECCFQGRRRKMESVNFGIANLIAAFGKERWWECWARIVRMYLIEWGINTIGNWSQYEFIQFAKIPYVLPLDAYSKEEFPTTKNKIFRDFPDVFAQEYEENSEMFALTLDRFKKDPYLIGYFMRNEPEWAFVYGLNIAEEMLANPQRTISKQVFIERMIEKYNVIANFNKAWNLRLDNFNELYSSIHQACKLSKEAETDLINFSKEMITRYVEIPSQKCKKIDGNHLNLGMRYAFITDPILLSGYENFDVFSINSYQINPYKQISEVGELLNMPVMLGEFHHGALDRGLTATGIRGVADQNQRGAAYRYYVEQGTVSPYFLGAHYFMFNDQSCLGRFDGENYQIGLVDICLQEYEEMTKEMKACHNNIYEVCNGESGVYSNKPVEIPAIFY